MVALVPAYNEAAGIGATIQALLAQFVAVRPHRRHR